MSWFWKGECGMQSGKTWANYGTDNFMPLQASKSKNTALPVLIRDQGTLSTTPYSLQLWTGIPRITQSK